MAVTPALHHSTCGNSLCGGLFEFCNLYAHLSEKFCTSRGCGIALIELTGKAVFLLSSCPGAISKKYGFASQDISSHNTCTHTYPTLHDAEARARGLVSILEPSPLLKASGTAHEKAVGLYLLSPHPEAYLYCNCCCYSLWWTAILCALEFTFTCIY